MTPVLVKTVADLRRQVAGARQAGRSVGLVPTMGALHAGHASLIRAARAGTDFVVVTIFVNPAQFGPHEDFHRYPRPLGKDLDLCAAEGVDVVFAPAVEEVYPPGCRTVVEVPGLQDVLEGASRPGHFRGVCTVVLKLFQMALPDRAYFGQKDAQQALIVRRMTTDLNLPLEVVVCPTVREPDGLALSSRNQYLTAEQRGRAVVLSRSLREAAAAVDAGERSGDQVRRLLTERITATPGAELDYAAVVDADTLEPLAELRGRILMALAVRFGSTRLIDNVLLELSA